MKILLFLTLINNIKTSQKFFSRSSSCLARNSNLLLFAARRLWTMNVDFSLDYFWWRSSHWIYSFPSVFFHLNCFFYRFPTKWVFHTCVLQWSEVFTSWRGVDLNLFDVMFCDGKWKCLRVWRGWSVMNVVNNLDFLGYLMDSQGNIRKCGGFLPKIEIEILFRKSSNL